LESYFKRDIVKGAFEYDDNKLIALVHGRKNILFVNRLTMKEESSMRIAIISNADDYKSLSPFPNYSYESFPYVMIKDTKSLNVVNLRTKQSRVILKDTFYNWDIIRTCIMDF
jgi:hypothetical protein